MMIPLDVCVFVIIHSLCALVCEKADKSNGFLYAVVERERWDTRTTPIIRVEEASR
jgi:hypothetical protein